MKNKILTSKKIIFAWLFMFALTISAAAQTFRQGETVETNDGRVCKILSISGRSAKVACGANRSDVRVYSFESLTSEAAAEAQREQMERQKQAAANSPKPRTVVFKVGDTVNTPDGRTGKIESFKTMSDLVKVQFADGSTQYFELNDLKKAVDPTKPTFRVGDRVFKDGKSGVIEAIEGNGFKVRIGPGKYDFVLSMAENLMTPQQAAEEQESARQEKAQKPLRAQFMDEAQAFSMTVFKLAPVFDPKYYAGGTGITQENKSYEAWRKDLENLDAVCRKYPNMTNPSLASNYQSDIKMFPADWCKMAAQRTEVLQKTKRTVGDMLAKTGLDSLIRQINKSLDDEEGYVGNETQIFLYDRAAWDRANLPAMRKHYLDPNATISPELLKPLEEKAAELRAQIEQDAPKRSWTEPKTKDAALEAAARRKFSAELPGVKILKTGMTDSSWAVMDSKTEIGGTNTGWRFYRINKGAYRYRSGRALIQLPNQPFCQIREFEVTQYKAGAGYGAANGWVADTGKFVKCQ